MVRWLVDSQLSVESGGVGSGGVEELGGTRPVASAAAILHSSFRRLDFSSRSCENNREIVVV